MRGQDPLRTITQIERVRCVDEIGQNRDRLAITSQPQRLSGPRPADRETDQHTESQPENGDTEHQNGDHAVTISQRINRGRIARPAGFEPATGGLEVHCSIR
jgi:hypothetical protein